LVSKSSGQGLFILNRKYEAREMFIGFQTLRHVIREVLRWAGDMLQRREAVFFGVTKKVYMI